MSTDILFRVWVDREDIELVIREVSGSSNCSPQPSGFQLSKSFAQEWRRFGLYDETGIRDWVSSIAKSYAGGMIRETNHLRGDEAWNRWRNRFRRAGGPDIGPPPASLTWNGAPSVIALDPAVVLDIRRGEVIDLDMARAIIGAKKRVPIYRLGKDEEELPERVYSSGALGFLVDDIPHYYLRRKRNRGYKMRESEVYLSTVTAKIHLPRTGVISPECRSMPGRTHRSPGLAELTADDWLILGPDGAVLCGCGCYSLVDVAKLATCSHWEEPAAFSEAKAKQAVDALNRDFNDTGWHAKRAIDVFPALPPRAAADPSPVAQLMFAL